MYILIVCIPIIVGSIVGIFGRNFGYKGSIILINGGICVTSILSIIGFYEVMISDSSISIELFNILYDDYLNVNLGFVFDSINMSFIITIILVSCMVHIFTVYYMSGDAHIIRFMVYLNMFTGSMIFLVSSNNFIGLFIGWEFIGIFSYLLINFWYTRIDTNMAAIKAFSINRIGDVFYTIMLFMMYLVFGDMSFEIINSISNWINHDILYYLCIIILFASIGKSAQFGFHIWLPFSMEG